MLHELRHFLLVAEHGTFTAASRHAHLSQPALSASIQRLERDIGASLLVRTRHGAELSAAGRALLPRARAALAAVEDGRRAAQEIVGLSAGEVRLGAGATACTYLLPPLLARYRVAFPNVRFLLREAPPDAVLDALDAGELDLGIITTERGEPWRLDSLVLVAAPGVDAASAPFVTFPPGSTTRTLLDRTFPGAPIVMELGSIAAIKGNVRAGIGVALVSRAAVETDLSLGRLVLVPHPKTPITRLLSIVHRGLERLPPAASALRTLLLENGDRAAGKRGRRRPSAPQARQRRAEPAQ